MQLNLQTMEKLQFQGEHLINLLKFQLQIQALV